MCCCEILVVILIGFDFVLVNVLCIVSFMEVDLLVVSVFVVV